MRVWNRCSICLLLVAAAALAACGDSLPADPDDTDLPDAALPDTPDAALPDAALPDAALPDAAPPDASPAECEGQADGTPCGDATDGECDAADTCQGGVCVSNVVADGEPCGDPGAGECDAADTCAAGVCASNNADDGIACGDPTDTECDLADSCSAGACLGNLVADGIACGDPTETECDAADTCSVGVCADNLATDGDPCGDDTDTECDAADSCSAGTCADNLATDGDPCGDTTDTECDAADTCSAGTCADNLATDGDPCGDTTDTECDAADTCSTGTCADNLAADGDPCGSGADTDCDDPDTCSSGSCATNGEADGTVCYDCAGGPGQCATCTSAGCDEVACTLGDPAALVAPAPHGNGNAGYMFDIEATNTVTITSFDIYPAGTLTGVEIYTKTGTHVGFETTAGAWTLVGSSGSLPADGNNPVPVPIAVDTTIASGTTSAFYVTAIGGNTVHYHNGTSRATVAVSDANITLFQGTGKSYPFGGSNITRVFEGVIHYASPFVPGALDSSTGTATGGDVDSAMFDIVATNAVEEADTLSVELAAGTFDVDVYFRRGSHVGFEGSAAGWELLASEAGVVSAGGGALSDISLASPVDIEAGDTAAFYVDTGDGEAGLQTDPGGAVGDPAATTADQSMLVGRALAGGFGAAGAAAIFRGSLVYGECAAP